MTTKKTATISVLLVFVVGSLVLLTTTVVLPANGPCVITSTPPAPPAEPTEPAAADESGDPTATGP